MATLPIDFERTRTLQSWRQDLGDPRLAIGGTLFDALLLWGSPLIALLLVSLWLDVSVSLPQSVAEPSANGLAAFATILTYAHLIAVAPRAYLNRQVFAAYRMRLIIVPVLLLGALALSPVLLAIGLVIAIFWDVHHSAMQNFGLGRIYDMKAGNDVRALRATDLRLNWMLYVGPLVAGASLAMHLDYLRSLDQIDLVTLARLPGILEGHHSALGMIAMAAWAFVIGWSVLDYRRAMARGYKLSAHKLVLLVSTGSVSLIAWGFSSPLVALISINIYHAVQYFALVWLKEGERMTVFSRTGRLIACNLFLAGCAAFGIAYYAGRDSGLNWLAGLFVGCSLLHFWFDGFVWSVGRRHV